MKEEKQRLKERFRLVRLAGRWRGLRESEIIQTLDQRGGKKGKSMFHLTKKINQTLDQRDKDLQFLLNK